MFLILVQPLEVLFVTLLFEGAASLNILVLTVVTLQSNLM